MARPLGTPKQGGRKKGTPNKITQSVKEVFIDAFNKLQLKKGVNLADWGTENPSEFYRLTQKLIPAAIEGTLSIKLGKDLEEEEYEE